MATEGGAGFLTRREAVGLACVAVGAAALAGSPATALADAATSGAVFNAASGQIPVTLTAAEWAVSADGSSIAFGIDVANNGGTGYSLVRAEVMFYDSAGKVISSEGIELLGWLPAGGTARRSVSVPLPAGAYSFLISSPTSAEVGETRDFPERGLRLTCGPVETSDAGISVPAVLENTGDATYVRVGLVVRALDAGGFVVGSAAVEAIGVQDAPLTPGAACNLTLEVPFPGAASIFVEGVSGAEDADALAADPQTVLFGRWNAHAWDSVDPIEWLVVARDGSRRLLLTKNCIACRRYHDDFSEITWEACSLRAWLNTDFLWGAFTQEERTRIAEVVLHNDDNADYGTPGGSDTLDRVFCLSLSEVQKYYGSASYPGDGRGPNPDLVAVPTARAVIDGVWVDEETGGSCWCLRSPGINSECAAFVASDGTVYADGDGNMSDFAIRPALWVNDLPEVGDAGANQTGVDSGSVGGGTSDQPVFGPDGTVSFGTWALTAQGAPGPIEWVVLDDEGSRKLLLTKYGIDVKLYNETSTDVTWSDCTLRSWLNGDFFKGAFTQEERSHIAKTLVQNDDNPDYGTPGGPDTSDYVFCLSVDQMVQYFGAIPSPREGYGPCEDLVTFATDYAIARHAYVNEETGGCMWWLRSPGNFAYTAADVQSRGTVYSSGNGVGNQGVTVRPAMWVDL